jgi:hypothetical protein
VVKKRRKAFWLVLAGVAIALFLTGVVFAQSGGAGSTRSFQDTLTTGYDLSWQTVDGGGATFNSGVGASAGLSTSYSLGGTAGQPDAGVLAGGGYTLGGGFWGAGASAPVGPTQGVYLPLVVR